MCVLKQEFQEWEEWIFGDDRHSLQNQIHDMIWDAATFLTINEARKYATIDQEGKLEVSGLIHHFIDRCFLKTQVIAIRKLLDNRKGVISLRRLITNIENAHALLTRENILAAHDYPYNYEEEEKKIRESISGNQSPTWMPNNYKKCVFAKHVHESIDSLAGIDPSQRKPNDTIRKRVFRWLRDRLDSCEEICEYVNNFIAHSVKLESRQTIQADEIKITLGKLMDAHQIICETVAFIAMNILYRSLGGFLATPQYNQLEHFDKPLVSESDLKNLYAFWRTYHEDTESWDRWEWQKDFNEHATKVAGQ